MTDSFRIGSLECLDRDGDTYLLLSTADLGAPAADTTAIAGLLRDGEVVAGSRSRNRALRLPIRVSGSTRGEVRARVESLFAVVNAAMYVVVYTPPGEPPVAFDCFRGNLTEEWGISGSGQPVALVTIDAPALPFTRPVSPQQISPTAGASVQVDAFDNITGLTNSIRSDQYATTYASNTATANTTTKVEGSASVVLSQTYLYAGTPHANQGDYPTIWSWSRTFTAKDLSATPVVSLQNYFGGLTPEEVVGSFWTLKLSSSGGRSSTWKVTAPPSFGGFSPISWVTSGTPMSTTSGGVDLTAVTGYTVEWSWQINVVNPNNGSAGRGTSILLDDLRAYSQQPGLLSAPSGVVTYPAVLGSARTPASLTVTCSGGAQRLLIARSPNPPAGFSPAPIPSSYTGRTADATAVSGFTYNAPIYTLKAAAYSGSYSLMLRVKNASGVTFTVTMAQTGGISRTLTRKVSTADTATGTGGTNGYILLDLGKLQLPGRNVDPANTTSTFTLTFNNVGAIDQLYLLDDAGEFLLIDSPSGTATTYFFIDPPSAVRPYAQILGGAQPDRSDAQAIPGAYLRGPASFSLDPGVNALAVLADKATAVTVAASYYPRYFGSAG